MSVNPVEAQFGSLAREARVRIGFSQSQVAEWMAGQGFPGRHQTTVSKIEHAQHPVTLSEAAGLAALLGFDFSLRDAAGSFSVPCRNCLGVPRPRFICADCGAEGKPAGEVTS